MITKARAASFLFLLAALICGLSRALDVSAKAPFLSRRAAFGRCCSIGATSLVGAGASSRPSVAAEEKGGGGRARGAVSADDNAARRNPTDQWGGALLGSKEPVKQSALCKSGLYTNVAMSKCTDVGDIGPSARATDLDKSQDAAADKLAARMLGL